MGLLLALALAAPTEAEVPFSEESVQQVVESHRPEIQACLDAALEQRGLSRKALKEGPVVVRFVLTSKGVVGKASIKQSVPKSPEFHTCLLKQVRTWKFPRPNDGKLHPIEYPFDVKVEK